MSIEPPMPSDPQLPTTVGSRVGSVAGATLLVATVVASAALLVLWHRSFRTFDEGIVPGPGGELRVASNDGAVVMGVFRDHDAELKTRSFWRRPRQTEYARLLNRTSDPVSFAIAPGPYEIGVVVPHWALAIPPAVASAWWLLGDRRRHVLRHRRAHGLCGQCGYDLRQSPERCPECGARRDAFIAPAPPAAGGAT
jgi:hypothetical protein